MAPQSEASLNNGIKTMNTRLAALAAICVLALGSSSRAADPLASTNAPPDWLTRPLSLMDAISVALERNSTILKGRSDLEASYGVVVQTRAIALPKLQGLGDFRWSDQIEELSLNDRSVSFQREKQWTASIRVVQSVYEGGRIKAALHTAKLTKEQALTQFQTVVADTLLQVRTAYFDTLLAAAQIDVQRASVALLQKELDDTTRRFDAGTVPRFNVLRAEVEVANARPRLIRAGNAHRIAKNNLANLLGFDLPANIWEDIPLQLTGTLEVEPYEIDLPVALAQALLHRSELASLRKVESIRREAIRAAKAGYLPSLQVFAGHGWRNATFSDNLAADIAGWNAGAQVTWNFFDGLQTKGKLDEAKALHQRARHDLEDNTRRVELEVRTAYSSFIEAKEVLKSQEKVQEQAEEALRLANSRYEAGTGTQLDVLNAQTALTEARTTQVQARHDYAVARARLQRAVGLDVVQKTDSK
jgi:outer membrane protein TolC